MNAVRPTPAARGFSLMEVAVSSSFITIFLIAALSILEQARHTTRRTMSLASAQQSGTYAMQELSANVKRAGFMIGKRSAILKSSLIGTTQYTATWNNYTATSVPSGIWSINPAGGKLYTPVAGTDGITVRYSNDQPPIHVCVMPNGNAARIELAYDPALDGSYPTTPGQSIDFISTAPCPGYSGDNEAYLIHTTVQQAPGQNNPGGNCSCAGQNCNLQNPTSCVAMDPLCNQIYTNRFNACYKVVIDNIGCDLCAVGPTYMISANSATYWLSTEDGSGNPAVSRPVLVGREGLGEKPARIIATDIEDLQLNYSLDPLDPAAGGVASGADGMPPMINNPSSAQLGAVRAVRVNVLARTPSIDLMAKNPTYCAAHTRLVPLFTRPEVEDHPQPAAGSTGYCDGYRRSLYTQTMYLANMRSNPL